MEATEFLNLSISTRIIAQLGEQLISDEIVALMELIKNAYDADATKVEIRIDTKIQTEHGIGKIEIKDNGNGMTPHILQKSFLRISTSFKEVFKTSPYFKRLVLGKKGLGRLSFNRLGRFINVYTTPRLERIDEDLIGNIGDYNQFQIFVDWDKLYVDKDFNEIKAELSKSFSENPVYGTKIEILGIKNLNFWNLDKDQKQRLRNEIFGMINPFSKDRESKFEVYLYIDDELYTNEEINENLISEISDVAAKFSFDKDWILRLTINKKERYVEKRIGSAKSNLENDEVKLKLVEKNIPEEILNKEIVIDLKNEEILNKEFPKINLKLDMVNDDFAFPGTFNGCLYAADFSKKKEIINDLNSENIKTTTELESIWEQAQGVYVFRNEFRILPYGKNDWLDFTKRSQKGKSNIYKEHSVAGYFIIDGENSENLQEQTNRQGFIEDEYGNNFLRIAKDVIAELLFQEDTKFRVGMELSASKQEGYAVSKNGFLKYELKKNAKKEKKEKLDEVISQVNSMNADIHDINDIRRVIANVENATKEFVEYDKKYEMSVEQEKIILKKQIEEIKEIAPMVGQAIIVESMTHELNRIESNVKQYAKNSLDIAYTIEDGFEPKYKLIDNQKSIIDETVYLRAQLNHLEPTYRNKKNIIEEIDLKKLLETSYKKDGPMSMKAKNEGINVKIEGDSFKVKSNRGYLITVFDNLFLNSLHWISYKNERVINIEINKNGKIFFWDSGDGIHPDIENILFDPFTSMKKDGRGLGLYIVTELLEQMNSQIYLDDERKDGRLYKFCIDLSNIMEE